MTNHGRLNQAQQGIPYGHSPSPILYKVVCGIMGLTLVSLLSAPTWAFTPADPNTLLSARSSGRGSSSAMAADQSHDGLLVNSASLAFRSQYAISFGLTGMGQSIGASIVDSKSGPLGGGLYYIRRDFKSRAPNSLLLGDFRRVEERAGLALFTKFSDRFAVGLLGKFLRQTGHETGVPSGKAFNGDLSLAVVAAPEFRLGFAAQNLFEDKLAAEPKAFIFGAEYLPTSTLSVSGQVMNYSASDSVENYTLPQPGAMGWSLGAQYRISDFQIRAGYLKSTGWNRELISGGLGYGQNKFSVDYSFQLEQGTNNQYHGISVSGYL